MHTLLASENFVFLYTVQSLIPSGGIKVTNGGPLPGLRSFLAANGTGLTTILIHLPLGLSLKSIPAILAPAMFVVYIVAFAFLLRYRALVRARRDGNDGLLVRPQGDGLIQNRERLGQFHKILPELMCMIKDQPITPQECERNLIWP